MQKHPCRIHEHSVQIRRSKCATIVNHLRRYSAVTTIVCHCIFGQGFLHAAEASLSPFLYGEAAGYYDDNIATTSDQIASLVPGYSADIRGSQFSLYSKLAYRFDSFDAKRDSWYFGENYLEWQDSQGSQNLSAGLQRIQLGTLEIFQSLDLINDSITDSYLSEINRQGYPILSYKSFTQSSKLSLYFLPYFYAPYYPANSARLGFGVEFDEQQVVTASGDLYDSGSTLSQYGGKWDYSFESMDITLGFFSIADRSLSFILIDQNLKLVRYFFEEELYFFTTQWSFDNFILKSNLYYKNFAPLNLTATDLNTGLVEKSGPMDHTVLSFGFENKISLLKGHDTTFLLEYQKLFGVSLDLVDRYNVFSNDAAWGLRHSFNDALNKQITLFHIIDLKNAREQIFQLDYKQNINDNMKIAFGLRTIQAQKRSKTLTFDNLNGLAIIEDADSVYTTLGYVY